MTVDPILKMFFILIAAIIGTNAAWFLYVSGIEDEIALIYKLFEGKALKKSDKKKIEKIERRLNKNAKRNKR